MKTEIKLIVFMAQTQAHGTQIQNFVFKDKLCLDTPFKGQSYQQVLDTMKELCWRFVSERNIEV